MRIESVFFLVVLLLGGITSAFAFENDRPSATWPFDCREDTASTNDEASLGLGVHVYEYEENYEWQGLGSKDYVELRIAATANTRKGISYSQSVFSGLFDWVEATSDAGIFGDDRGKWFDLDFPVRFYGGPGHSNASNEYRRVWVSSNGFLSFTDNSTSPDPKMIPDSASPNALLAVYWSDLITIGGAIKYYRDSSMFVVLWDNVLNKRNNIRQTFEVIIESTMTPYPYGVRGQNRITFLYESVTWSSDAKVGIEDQEGCKGTIPNPRPNSGEGVLFASLVEAPEIKKMTIKLQKSDDQAIIRISRENYSIVGHNLKLENRDEKDTNGLVEKAISGYGSLLVSTALKTVLHVSSLGGFVIGTALVTIPLVIQAAREMHPANVPDAVIHDACENDNLAFVSAFAETIPYPQWGYPVDALLGIRVFWIFMDHNSCDHSITITADLEYYSYTTDSHQNLTISQPLTVTFLHETEPKLVYPPVTIKASLGVDDQADDFKFWVGGTKTIKADMDPPAFSDFDMELLNPYGEVIAFSRNRGYEIIETIYYDLPDANDFYTIRVIFHSGKNDFYTLNLRVQGEGGSGGGYDPPPLMMAW